MILGGASLLAAHRHAIWEDFDALTWGIVVVAAVVAAWSIWKAVRYTIRPGEAAPEHIKRSILDEPARLHVEGLGVAVSSVEDAGGSGPRADSPPAPGA